MTAPDRAAPVPSQLRLTRRNVVANTGTRFNWHDVGIGASVGALMALLLVGGIALIVLPRGHKRYDDLHTASDS